MSAVLLLGLPGSGKSTVANSLAARGYFSWLSASQVLREHAEASSSGAKWKRLWNAGQYAPDSEALPVLWDSYAHRAGWVLLDGYPRTTEQLADFTARGGTLQASLLLRISQGSAIERLRLRAAREGRDDDVDHVAQHRVATERTRIDELCTLTAVRTSLIVVDAEAPADEVTNRALTAITGVMRPER